LNRLKDAKEMIGTNQQWKQTFTYDRYGNRNFDTANNNTTTIPIGCAVAVCNPQIDPATNKLSVINSIIRVIRKLMPTVKLSPTTRKTN
jgi:hypothetical protein